MMQIYSRHPATRSGLYWLIFYVQIKRGVQVISKSNLFDMFKQKIIYFLTTWRSMNLFDVARIVLDIGVFIYVIEYKLCEQVSR